MSYRRNREKDHGCMHRCVRTGRFSFVDGRCARPWGKGKVEAVDSLAARNKARGQGAYMVPPCSDLAEDVDRL